MGPGSGRIPSPSIFDQHDVLEFTLAAPFQDLFDRADRDADFSVPAVLSYRDKGTGRMIQIEGVDVSVRGNTSRRGTECSFPKLKLRLPGNGVPGESPFHDLRTLKIGTHCGDLADGQLTFQFGRWGNEKSPFREGLVYRLLEAADVSTLRTRLARITYVYRGAPSGGTEQKLVRNALLLEDEADAMERLGAVGELIVPGNQPARRDRAAGTFDNAQRQFAETDSARVAFAQAMIGNFDWALRFTEGDQYRDDGKKGLWNVLALARGDGTAFPLVQDFDLAGIVTGRHPWYREVYPARFMGADSPPAVEVLAQVQRTRSLFTRRVLDATRAAFLARKQTFYALAADAVVDPGGRANAQAYLNAFFNAIESDAAFYLPVIVGAGTVPYLDASGSRPACGPGQLLPVGTPAAPARDRNGALVRAEVLDVFWRWGWRKCEAIRRAPVWVDAAAIAADYPR